MNQQQLTSLRTQIVGDLVPLALTNSDAFDRFNTLLRVIQSGGASSDVYTKAYESAQQIESSDERMNALLALLDEIDFDVSRAVENQSASASTQENGPANEASLDTTGFTPQPSDGSEEANSARQPVDEDNSAQ